MAGKGAQRITEVDCKKQFDNICPSSVVVSFSKASKWLYKKRHWRQHTLHWSIHRDTPKLDLAGIAAWDKFPGPQNSAALLCSQLLHDNALHAVGKLWSQLTSIPMGGLFQRKA